MTALQHRELIVEQHRYLCRRGARKFLRPGIERADLEQVAAIGLIKAADRYDAALSTPFEAFAWLFILGELMHYVRDYERLVRPPRRLRDLDRRSQIAYDELTASLGREPSATELADALNVDLRTVDDLYEYRQRAIPEALHDLRSRDLEPVAQNVENREDLLVIEKALARLSETERTIILALYASGYSQVELADRLGYSQRHISRLHRAALRKMQPAWVQKTA